MRDAHLYPAEICPVGALPDNVIEHFIIKQEHKNYARMVGGRVVQSLISRRDQLTSRESQLAGEQELRIGERHKIASEHDDAPPASDLRPADRSGEDAEVLHEAVDVGLVVLDRDEPLLDLAPGREEDPAVVLIEPVRVVPNYLSCGPFCKPPILPGGATFRQAPAGPEMAPAAGKPASEGAHAGGALQHPPCPA